MSASGTVHAYEPSPANGPAGGDHDTPSREVATYTCSEATASSASVAVHRIVCVEPPVQSSPPAGPEIAIVGGVSVVNVHDTGQPAKGFPGSLPSVTAHPIVTSYAVPGSNSMWPVRKPELLAFTSAMPPGSGETVKAACAFAMSMASEKWNSIGSNNPAFPPEGA